MEPSPLDGPPPAGAAIAPHATTTCELAKQLAAGAGARGVGRARQLVEQGERRLSESLGERFEGGQRDRRLAAPGPAPGVESLGEQPSQTPARPPGGGRHGGEGGRIQTLALHEPRQQEVADAIARHAEVAVGGVLDGSQAARLEQRCEGGPRRREQWPDDVAGHRLDRREALDPGAE